MSAFGIRGVVSIDEHSGEELIWKKQLKHIYEDLRYGGRGTITLNMMNAQPTCSGYLVLTNHRLLFLPHKLGQKGAVVRDITLGDIKSVEVEKGGGLKNIFKDSPYSKLLVRTKGGTDYRFPQVNFAKMDKVAKDLNTELKKLRKGVTA